MKNIFSVRCELSIRPIAIVLLAILLNLPAGHLPISIATAQEGGAIELTNVFAVVRAQGAVIIDDATGKAGSSLAAGSLVLALARSESDGLLYVQGEEGNSGWVSAAALLIVNPSTVPLRAPAFQQDASTQGPVDAGQSRDKVNTPAASQSAGPGPLTVAELLNQDAPSLTVADAMKRTTDRQDRSGAVDSITEETTAALAKGQVNLQLNNLNLRSGPGVAYPLVGSAPPETVWGIQGRVADSSWVLLIPRQAAAGGPPLWAATKYLTISGKLPEVAVIKDIPPPPEDQPDRLQAAASTVTNGRTGVFGLSGTLALQDRIGGTIYVYRFGSGTLTAVTGGIDPAISPDGRQIAFTRDGGEGGLFVINADGSDERRIYKQELLRSPKWSPDGTKLVFSRLSGTEDCRILSGGVCLSDEKILDSLPPGLQGGDAKNLVRDLRNNREYFYALSRIAVDGSDYRDVPGMAKSVAPDWESGGIVYHSEAGIQITADRGDARSQQIAYDPNQGYFHDPDWQPDGGRIVFHRKLGQHWQIFGVNSDGSGLAAMTRPVTALVDELPSNASPAWSPDGQHIVYVSNRNSIESAGAWHLWVMNADGSDQKRLPVDVVLDYTFASEQMVSWGR